MYEFLDFPAEAKQAARRAVEKWRVDTSQPLENLISNLECEVANNLQFHDEDYGVEDAINSGTRMRLLHQVKDDKNQFNCGEAAINAFLVLDTFGAENLRLLRKRETLGSDHFYVLRYHSGLDNNPCIINPLSGEVGDIHLGEGKLTYYPTNWQPDVDLKTAFTRTKPEERPSREKAQFWIMDKDELIRQINYLNGPSGFFDYYKDGQRIRMLEAYGLKRQEYSVQTEGEDLILRATFDSLGGIMFYTFERRYNPQGMRERKILHNNMQWVRPRNIFSVMEDGMAQVYQLEAKVNSAMRAFEFIRHIMDRGFPIYTKQTHQAELDRIAKLADFGRTDLARLKQEFEKEFGPNSTRFDAPKHEEMLDAIAKIKHDTEDMEAFLKDCASYPESGRALLLDSVCFYSDFTDRKIRPRKPYHKFTPKENPTPVLEIITNIMHETSLPYIEEHFSSKAVTKLLEQHAEALQLKRLSEHVLGQAL